MNQQYDPSRQYDPTHRHLEAALRAKAQALLDQQELARIRHRQQVIRRTFYVLHWLRILIYLGLFLLILRALGILLD